MPLPPLPPCARISSMGAGVSGICLKTLIACRSAQVPFAEFPNLLPSTSQWQSIGCCQDGKDTEIAQQMVAPSVLERLATQLGSAEIIMGSMKTIEVRRGNAGNAERSVSSQSTLSKDTSATLSSVTAIASLSSHHATDKDKH